MVWILVSTSERITRLDRDSLFYVELVSIETHCKG
uniref:Uncharacterized protein n=1 Tax=Myoviridae sp. ctijX18 TaxID=2825154 RepID=A0A8S5USZ4_9CAUD|nr:MAG TPA: hypothetical protein [Myoviridae sp. ctijX18]DAJ68990.1 MAG TPA: hypothetical protein [Caudoviricetes sp.]